MHLKYKLQPCHFKKLTFVLNDPLPEQSLHLILLNPHKTIRNSVHKAFPCPQHPPALALLTPRPRLSWKALRWLSFALLIPSRILWISFFASLSTSSPTELPTFHSVSPCFPSPAPQSLAWSCLCVHD